MISSQAVFKSAFVNYIIVFWGRYCKGEYPMIQYNLVPTLRSGKYMNMENILEVIYTQASKRIKKKVQENKNQEKKPQKSNLTQAKIYPPDPKQIS